MPAKPPVHKSLPTPGQIFAALRAAVAEPILLSRDTEATLWAQAATNPDARGVLADYLEERGDPLHHVLRNHKDKNRYKISRLVPFKYNHHGYNIMGAASMGSPELSQVWVMKDGFRQMAKLPPDVIKEIQEYHGDVSPVAPESR